MRRIPHVAIYCRVSTTEQAEEGLSIEAQPANCLRKLDETFGTGGYTHEIFRDLGKSGGLGPKPWATEIKGRERKGLWDMIQRIRKGEFTHVIAFRGDRIYRDHLGALGFYADLLKPRGVKLMFVAEDFDESLTGQLTAGMLAGIAEYQRKQIGENIERTLEHRRSAGFYLGTTPFGWRRERPEEHVGRRPNILPDEAQAPTVVRIKDLYLSGTSERAIADLLNRERVPHKKRIGAWSPNTVGLVLTCSVHAGLVRVKKDGELGRGFHHAHRFYEESEYRRILDRLSRNRKRLRGVARSQPFRLFAGLARCGHCGKALQSSFHSDPPNYRCLGNAASESGAHVYMHAGYLESLVVEELRALAADPGVVASAEDEIEGLVRSQDDALRSEAQGARRAIDALEAQASKVMDAVRNGAIPQRRAKEAFDGIEKDQTALQARLVEIEAVLSASEAREDLARRAKRRLEDFPLLWGSMTDAERRECLHTVLERVDVFADPDRKWVRLSFATGAEPREVDALRGAERYRSERLDGVAALTPRELAALKHVLDGWTYVKVAEFFESTASNAHCLLSRAAVKLGVKTHREAATKAEFMIRRVQDQLPLFGPYRHPRTKANRLRVTEYQVLTLVAGGMATGGAAARTGVHEERVIEMLRRALKKTETESPEDAMRAVEERPELLPPTMENRRRVG